MIWGYPYFRKLSKNGSNRLFKGLLHPPPALVSNMVKAMFARYLQIQDQSLWAAHRPKEQGPPDRCQLGSKRHGIHGGDIQPAIDDRCSDFMDIWTGNHQKKPDFSKIFVNNASVLRGFSLSKSPGIHSETTVVVVPHIDVWVFCF